VLRPGADDPLVTPLVLMESEHNLLDKVSARFTLHTVA